MKKEDLRTRIQAIGQLQTVEEMRTQLATFQTDLETDYDERDELQATNQNLTTDMENLRKTNMALFLQIGNKKEPDKTGLEPASEDLKYENLFDDKGGLK